MRDILPFAKNGGLGIPQNYLGIYISIVAKIYNSLLRNRIEPKIEKILRKNQNGFRRNRSMKSQIVTIRRILICVCAKNLEATVLFVDFSKAFDSIHRRKQILLAYDPPKKNVAAIMMLYKNTKVKFRSPDGETDYSDNVAGILQRGTLTPYLFIKVHILRPSKFNRFNKKKNLMLAKERRKYPAQFITEADYTDDIVLLASTLAQAEFLMQSLERAAGRIGLYANAYKTEYMCLNQRGDISTVNGGLLESWRSSPTSEEGFHQLKRASKREKQRHGQLSIGYWSYIFSNPSARAGYDTRSVLSGV